MINDIKPIEILIACKLAYEKEIINFDLIKKAYYYDDLFMHHGLCHYVQNTFFNLDEELLALLEKMLHNESKRSIHYVEGYYYYTIAHLRKHIPSLNINPIRCFQHRIELLNILINKL